MITIIKNNYDNNDKNNNNTMLIYVVHVFLPARVHSRTSKHTYILNTEKPESLDTLAHALSVTHGPLLR